MNFLKKITETKRAQVAAAKKAVPLARLQDAARARTDFRDFSGALTAAGHERVAIIAEIKRASPSKGIICKDADAAVYAAAYENGGAAAISVLTETDFFKGGPHDLKTARSAQSLPVLRKDFIIDEYQVYESAAMGADAILLIVRILDQERLGRYLALASELGMDTLVEIFDECELEAAAAVGARLIGINNRNLDSFDTDVSRARRMAQQLGKDMVPVAASGVSCREDIEAGLEAGIYSFLVGESLMRAEDPESFLRSLVGIKA